MPCTSDDRCTPLRASRKTERLMDAKKTATTTNTTSWASFRSEGAIFSQRMTSGQNHQTSPNTAAQAGRLTAKPVESNLFALSYSRLAANSATYLTYTLESPIVDIPMYDTRTNVAD